MTTKKMKVLIISSEDNFVTKVAKGWLKKLEPDFKIYSAGTKSAGETDNLAILLMKESNIDITKYESHIIDEYLSQDWDYVITLYPDNSTESPELTGKINNKHFIKINDFFTLDNYRDDEKIEVYKSIINDIKNQIFDLYLKINNKEILGSDSCGVWCDKE